MNLYALLLNAVAGATSGALVAWLIVFVKRFRTNQAGDAPNRRFRAEESLENASTATAPSTSPAAQVPEPPLPQTAHDSFSELALAIAKLRKEQASWDNRLAEVIQPLADVQRSEQDLLRRQVQQELSGFRSELERLEKLLNKGQLGQSSARSSRPLGRKRALAAPASIGLFVLEVNGLRREYPIVANARMTLGRGASNDIVLQDMRLSETHVAFRSDGGSAVVEPLGAANPVLLNGRHLVKPTTLKGGDVLSFSGNSRLTFTVSASKDQPERAPTVVSDRQAKAG